MLRTYLQLILAGLVIAGCLAKIKKENIIYAIDIGANQQYKSKNAIQFSEDQYLDQESESRVADYMGTHQKAQIKYTLDPVIYKTERHADKEVVYHLPIEEPGSYVLVLKFVEMYFRDPNKRVFNIQLGDTVISKDFDIVAKGGYMGAVDEYFQFELTDTNLIKYNNQICENGINNQNSLVVKIVKGKADLPKIDGLMLLRGDLSDTDYQEYQDLKHNWEVRLKEQIKAEEKEKSNLYDQRQQLGKEFDPSLDNFLSKYQSGMVQLLKEPIGYINILLVILFFVCLAIIQDKKTKCEISAKSNKNKPEKKMKSKLGESQANQDPATENQANIQKQQTEEPNIAVEKKNQ